MTLDQNLEFFKSKREEWLDAGLEDKWLVVIDAALAAHFDTAERSYEFAVENAEPGQFLVKRLRREERPESIPAATLGILIAPGQ